MKVLILYRAHSEHGTAVESYVRDYSKQHPDAPIQLLDVDTVEGAAKAELYDVMQYPAVLALQEGGQEAQRWVGDHLPLMQEVAYYAIT